MNACRSWVNQQHKRSEVLDWLENEEFSILHFACHGKFDANLPNESTIKLSGGALCPSDIQTSFAGERPRPLVFINACHSAKVGFNFTKIGGWAARLLHARVGMFIGAMWEVTDSLALHFARSFYEKLLKDNQTVAKAFQEAREEIRQLAPYDSTWLAYVLYADPNSRIQDLERQEKITLQDLLLRLQTTIEDDAELDTDDKAEALEQLQVLTNRSQKSDDAAIKKAAKTAAKILRGTAAALPTDSLFANACQTILPGIATLLDI